MYQSREATLLSPRLEGAPWYIEAKAACASHELLPPASKDHHGATTWALVAFHFEKETHSVTQANPSLSKRQQAMSGKSVQNTATASPDDGNRQSQVSNRKIHRTRPHRFATTPP